MIKGKVLTILAALLGVTAACALGVAAYIIIQPGTSPENGVAETEAQLAGIEVVDNNGEHVDNDALPDISVDSGAVWTDSEVSNPEPEPESVIPEPESEPEYQNPGTHGGYLHEVGGVRFYTEHDLRQWLKPDEDYPEYLDFDIGQMLVDIWREDGGGVLETTNGFLYTDGIDFTKGVWFEVLDDDNNRLYRSVKFAKGLEEISLEMHDCPGPYGIDYYSILDGYSHLLHKELAELILYAAEQMVAGSPYEALSGLNLGANFSIY